MLIIFILREESGAILFGVANDVISAKNLRFIASIIIHLFLLFKELTKHVFLCIIIVCTWFEKQKGTFGFLYICTKIDVQIYLHLTKQA